MALPTSAEMDPVLVGKVMFGLLIFSPIIMVCIVSLAANLPLWYDMCLRRLRSIEQREQAGREQALAIA